jgi:glycosyltransferase involved in cell wall biosynthesis
MEWQLKRWAYNHSKLVVVAPSSWLAESARQGLFCNHRVDHIPYGIDTAVFVPQDQGYCRAQLGVPQDKRVLMFGAASLKDSRKGGDLLQAALKQLPQALKSEVVLLVLGKGGEAIAQSLNIETVNLGYVTDEARKAIAYGAADLFLMPTRADNLPLMLQESLACGTPMVSFRVGGVPDLVRPSITGYLAEPENAEDFAHGISQFLQDVDTRQRLGENCRAIALAEYRLELQAQRYCSLYQELLTQYR